MTSLRAGGSNSRSISGDRSRSRRPGEYIETESLERPQVPRKTNIEGRDSSQSKIPSRIPQTSTSRKPGLPEPSQKRPPLSHMNHSWGQTGTLAGPSRLASNFPASVAPPVKTQRNVLRRKHSGLSQETRNLHPEPTNDSAKTSSSSSIPRPPLSREPSVTPSVERGMTESPMEVRTAQTVEISKTTASTTTIYPELDRYQNYKPFFRSESPMEVPFKISTQDLPPPTPVFSGTSSHSQLSGYSASPSTRFSESPGPGPYSRDTTPTSMCSQSPGLISAMRMPAPRLRQGSISPGQTRPPVSRRRAGSIPNDADAFATDPHGLAAVRESLNSSSSNSTVRDTERREKQQPKKHLPPPPPSPPPRKSSQKFKKEEDKTESPARKPRQGIVVSPPPAKSPLNLRAKPPVSSKTPPARPSRDGTPDLQSQQFPVPVIHSNLSSSSIPERHERRQSSSLMPSALPRSTVPSSHHPSRLAPRREPTPALVTSGSEKRAMVKEGRSTRTPSPGISNFRTRFPIFGRRKTEPAVATQEKAAAKAPRKGPAAGTGHEGYGKIGHVRRRSASNATNLNTGLPSSQESLASNDPFLMDRVNPVIIAGGEVIENRNTSTELSRVDSSGSIGGYTSASSMGSQAGRTTMWPSAFQPQGGANAGASLRRPSNASTDSEGPAMQMKNTLAFRRSVQRLRSSPDSQVKIPKPIVVRSPGGIASPSITSLDSTGVLSDDSSVPPPLNPLPATNGPKKLTKKPGRWNFFGRSQAKKAAEAPKAVPASVAVGPAEPPKKAVAFYAMVDSSEQEDEGGTLDVEDVLLAANVLPHHAIAPRDRRRPSTSVAESARPSLPSATMSRRPSTSAVTSSTSQGHMRVSSGGSIPQLGHHPTPSGGNAMSSPPRPLAHTRSASTSAVPSTVPALVDPFTSSAQPSQPTQQAPKRSRLPQVGRIPKVVSGRPQHQPEISTQASPKSFSRPFNRLSVSGVYTPPQHSAPYFVNLDVQSLAKGPSPPRPATPELTQEASTITTITSGAGRMSRDMTTEGRGVAGQGSEFLAFSPLRKDSTCTSSTTSSCSGPLLSYATATAVVPSPGAPLAEDEIWDEYNDLIGEVPPSATSSHGKPFYLENLGMKLESPTVDMKMVIPSIAASLEPSAGAQKEFRVSHAPTTSSVYSQDMTARVQEVRNAELPTTPFSVSEFVGGYGERKHSLDMRVASIKRDSSEAKTQSPQRVPASQRSSTSSRKSRRTNSSTSSCLTAEDESPLAQVNLRVGSMTVSKWLTFGHVLFSPIREDLESLSVPQTTEPSAVGSPDSDPKRQSILVIDGLGNDDWSFYAAETYPGATFYNLSPRAPLTDEQKRASNGGFPLTPGNHHQIQFGNHMSRFPFGTDSFTSVVYRFPVAAPESQYRNIIAESRRVLKPGGFLELSILDVDLNNMGNRGRRAVRGLKEKIHATKPDINLSSTADLVLKILNRRGFTDVKTCRVGVPVCALPKKKDAATGKEKKQKNNPMEQRSLADMMSDTSELADKEITNMVAHVGRWWYSKCYENVAGIGVSNSMWRDRALVNECQQMGTSLKLMVCYARVPEKGGLGRVASI